MRIPVTEAPRTKTAGIVIIGDEILSGRTRDTNFATIATWTSERGVEVKAGRMVADIESEIVDAVNTLRSAYDYVFTTGGIGPTHDDITADSIGAAFGLPVTYHPDAYKQLEQHYGQDNFNEARKRMARTPEGAVLIENPISTAPGFQVENVFVMAGIPVIVEAMLESLEGRVTGGAPVKSEVVFAFAPEGDLAEGLGTIQCQFDDVSIGSYPGLVQGQYATRLVLRSADAVRLANAKDEVVALVGDRIAGPEAKH